MAAKKRKTKAQLKQQKELIRFSSVIATMGLVIVGAFRFGFVGVFIDNFMRIFIGQYPIPYYVLIAYVAMTYLVKPQTFARGWKFWSGVGLLLTSLILILTLSFRTDLVGFNVLSTYIGNIAKIFGDVNQPAYGGLVGAVVYGLLSFLFAREGVIVVIVVFTIIGLALLFTPAKMLDTANKGTEKTVGFLEARKARLREKREVKAREAQFAKMEAAIDAEQGDDTVQASQTRAGFLSLDDKAQPPAKAKAKNSLFMTVEDGVPGVKQDDDGSLGYDATAFEDSRGVLDGGVIETASSSHPDVMQPEIVEEITLPSAVASNLDNDTDARPDNFANYRIPPVSLLEGNKGALQSKENINSARDKSHRLISVLKQFGIEATMLQTHIGPAVTKFELKPDSNVKISKISSIQDNLMMELAVKTLRIEAPIPGKSAVGIEIPNVDMIPVKMRDVIHNSPNFDEMENINVALGKDLMGKPITVSLNKMPHLLVAGATGSGKSVCMNSIITSIILTKKPTDLKLLLIDPKKVEFTPYVNIPHLLGPVISDPMQASMALKVIVDEMDARYDLFSKAGVRNIGSYNEKVKQFPEENRERLPWIVVIIDELADLMAVAGKDVETSIQRITQLARAAGIHLIVATQRPSVDVVTGIIKANIPSRIAFAVSSAVDSRTILDTTGAEKLLGYGDMLYIPMGEPNPIRVQGCYVSDEEVRRIAEKSSVQAKPRFEDAFIRLDGVEGNSGILASTDEPLYDEAVEFVLSEQKASTSFLQRRFKIGYNRAANLIDALEQNGVIGPANGSKPREVYKSNVNADLD